MRQKYGGPRVEKDPEPFPLVWQLSFLASCVFWSGLSSECYGMPLLIDDCSNTPTIGHFGVSDGAGDADAEHVPSVSVHDMVRYFTLAGQTYDVIIFKILVPWRVELFTTTPLQQLIAGMK